MSWHEPGYPGRILSWIDLLGAFSMFTKNSLKSTLFILVSAVTLISCGVSETDASESTQISRPALPGERPWAFETFQSCIISEQLESSPPPMQSTKEICFEVGRQRCVSLIVNDEDSATCEKRFVKESEWIMKNGRQVECDSGSCTISG
jgi:hypothetical protein